MTDRGPIIGDPYPPNHKESAQPPVPAKQNIRYSRGMFVDIVC